MIEAVVIIAGMVIFCRAVVGSGRDTGYIDNTYSATADQVEQSHIHQQ